MSQRIPVEDFISQKRGKNFALEFDGESTVVEIPSLAREIQGPLTIEAWVRGRPTASAVVLFVMGGSARCQLNLEPLG
jgi:hypothetical protein